MTNPDQIYVVKIISWPNRPSLWMRRVSHIAMTLMYTYAPRGQRAISKVPRNYGAIMRLLASMSLSDWEKRFSSSGHRIAINGLAARALRQLYRLTV